MNKLPVYKDSDVSIWEEDGEIFATLTNLPKAGKFYIEAKLAEYIGNKFPGTWFAKSEEEAQDNKWRYFNMEWKEDKLYVKWY